MQGIMASYQKIIFEKDGIEVFSAQGSLGCLRRGEPKDSHDLIRQGLFQLDNALKDNKATVDAAQFTNVRVSNRNFTRLDLVNAGVIPAPKKTNKAPKP